MDKKSLNIAISGASGRMGKAIISMLTSNYQQHNISGKITSITTNSELNKIANNAEVIIDFSLPSATNKVLEAAIAGQTALVIGTTGLDQEQMNKIEQASNIIPILYAPNTSVGANLLTNISSKIAAILQDYDVEIIDTHHKYKKDSPSGTAIAIARSIAQARGDNYDDVVQIGRSGECERKSKEIGISSLRSGGIYGCHDVSFANQNEVITISHQALSRDVFAEGAIKAALWITSQSKGLYSMKDMLSLS